MVPDCISDGDEEWCSSQDSEYPTDLIELPFVQTTEEKPQDSNSATKYNISNYILLAFLALTTINNM